MGAITDHYMLSVSGTLAGNQLDSSCGAIMMSIGAEAPGVARLVWEEGKVPRLAKR